MGRGYAGEERGAYQIEHQAECVDAIESPELRQREGHQNQDRARHLEQEIDHPDRPLDTEFRILPVTAARLMIPAS